MLMAECFTQAGQAYMGFNLYVLLPLSLCVMARGPDIFRIEKR